MPEKIPCSACGRGVRVSAADAGRPVVCLACGSTFVAPPLPAGAGGTAAVPPPTPPRPAEIAPAPVDDPQVPYIAAPAARPDVNAAAASAAAGHHPRVGRAAAVLGACAAAVVLVALAAGAVLSARRGAHPAPQPAPAPRHDLASLLAQEESARRLALAGRFDEAKAQYDALARSLDAAGPSDVAAREFADRVRADRDTVERQIARRPTSQVVAQAAAPPATTQPAPSTRQAVALVQPIPPPPSVAVSPPRPAMPTTQPVAAAAPPKPTPRDDATAKADPAPPPRRPPIQPQPEPQIGVGDEQIGQSIQAGVDWLARQFDREKYQLRADVVGRGDPAYYCGLNALCVYALMQSGQALHDPRLDPNGPLIKGLIDRMKHLPAGPGHPEVYARGLRATALSLFARPEDRLALQADLHYLLEGHTGGAYTYQAVKTGRYTSGAARDGPWDNSNSQYGLLGVWSAAEAGEEVPMAYWKVVENHWTDTQSENGQWGYREPRRGGTLSMTAAGTASLFVTQEYLDRARLGAKVGRDPFSPALARALKWWETEDNSVSLYGNWWGYTLYGIERVGLASGFKYFGSHDWYRELARQAVARQRPDGSWAGVDNDTAGDPIETAYSLLFLARGRHPIVMNKLRFDGFWANRPRDASNLARFAGKQLERPLNWQVVSIDRPYQDWLDSPVLYLASHKGFALRERDVENLRGYVESGGLLFTHADGDGAAAFDTFIADLAHRLFPTYELRDLPPGHPLYSVVYKVNAAAAPLKAVSNGSRLLMVHAPSGTDPAKAWQLRDEVKNKPAFQLGVNVFVYAAGKRELRNRLSSPYVSDPGPPATGQTIAVARLQYPGNWDPEPGAWRRYARWFQRQTGIAASVKTVAWKSLRPDTAPFAHLTGTAAYTPSNEELNALRTYVQSGGVLLIDSTGGSTDFANSIDAALAKAFPNDHLNPIDPKQPLLHPAGSGMTDVATPKLRPYAAERLGRAAAPTHLQSLTSERGQVIFTPLDLTSGLLGTKTWAILGFDGAWAQDFMKNLLLWTLDGRPTPESP